MKNEYDYLNDVKMDFSVYDDEMKKEIMEMKKGKMSIRKIAVIAACAAAVAITGTAFASGYVTKIVKSISTGHNMMIQTDDTGMEWEIPEKLSGKFYDKDGNELHSITYGMTYGDLYDKDGNRYDEASIAQMFIDSGYADDADIRVEASKDNGTKIPYDDETLKVYTSLEEFDADLSFDLKSPEYVPDGYSFLYGNGYRDKDGKMSGNYAVLTYSNGKDTFSIHERVINDKTSFETSTNEDVTETLINGCTAAVSDHEIMWEQSGISITVISGSSSVTGGELLKVAESIK